VDEVEQDFWKLPLFWGLSQEVKHSVDDIIFLWRNRKRKQQQLCSLVWRQDLQGLQLHTTEEDTLQNTNQHRVSTPCLVGLSRGGGGVLEEMYRGEERVGGQQVPEGRQHGEGPPVAPQPVCTAVGAGHTSRLCRGDIRREMSRDTGQ